MATNNLTSAKALLDGGDLRGSIEQMTQEVRANPTDQRSRLFLFELLSFAGEFTRAERQLEAVAQTSADVKVEMGIQVYLNILKAELARKAFFSGKNNFPKFLTEPPGFAALHIEAVRAINEDRPEKAEKSLQESAEQQSSCKGQRDGRSFADIRDCDDLLGPIVELFLQGEYFWAPLEQLRKIEIDRPRTLRDLMWIPAKIEAVGALRHEGFIPVLYPNSCQDADDQVKLGRMTNWKMIGPATVRGVGARLYALDDNDFPLLELGTVEFSTSA